VIRPIPEKLEKTNPKKQNPNKLQIIKTQITSRPSYLDSQALVQASETATCQHTETRRWTACNLGFLFFILGFIWYL